MRVYVEVKRCCLSFFIFGTFFSVFFFFLLLRFSSFPPPFLKKKKGLEVQFCTLLRASSSRFLVTSSLSVPVTCTSSNSHSLSALKRSLNPVVFTTSSAYALSFLSLFSVLFVFFFSLFFFLFQLSARLTQS